MVESKSSPEGSARFAFEDFELDVAGGVLSQSQRPVNIRATPFRLLCCLVERRERIVSPDELIEAVWDGAAVSDTAISSALKELRQALGDSGKRPRFVQTKRRQGYRFVAPVSVRPPYLYVGRRVLRDRLLGTLEDVAQDGGRVIVLSGALSTTARSDSPNSGFGTPKTAQSATPSIPISAASISAG